MLHPGPIDASRVPQDVWARILLFLRRPVPEALSRPRDRSTLRQLDLSHARGVCRVSIASPDIHFHADRVDVLYDCYTTHVPRHRDGRFPFPYRRRRLPIPYLSSSLH